MPAQKRKKAAVQLALLILMIAAIITTVYRHSETYRHRTKIRETIEFAFTLPQENGARQFSQNDTEESLSDYFFSRYIYPPLTRSDTRLLARLWMESGFLALAEQGAATRVSQLKITREDDMSYSFSFILDDTPAAGALAPIRLTGEARPSTMVGYDSFALSADSMVTLSRLANTS